MQLKSKTHIKSIPDYAIRAGKDLLAAYQTILDMQDPKSYDVYNLGVGTISTCKLCRASNTNVSIASVGRNYNCTKCIHYAIANNDDDLFCMVDDTYLYSTILNPATNSIDVKILVDARMRYIRDLIELIESVKSE